MLELGFCGDDCSACPRYIATQSGSRERLKEVAEMWWRAGWRDTIVSPDEMVCGGCASVKWCRYDEIRKCAREKRIGNCGQCYDYPCAKITKVFEQTESYAETCKERVSKEDYECFHKAFFSKRERLHRINNEYLGGQ